MPAWREGRMAGQRARNNEQANRASSGGKNVTLPQAKERWAKQVCVYCGESTGRRVGYLALTGPVVFCRRHTKQYAADKKWEAIRKVELGL